MAEMNVSSSLNNRDQLYQLNITLRDLVEHKNIKHYLAELLNQVIKTALMEKYGEVQKILGDVINSPETRLLAEEIIRVKINQMAENAIKEMFGK